MNEEERKYILEGIVEVIKDMEARYPAIQLENGMLNLIYNRYKLAYKIIEEKKVEDKIIYINGGVRAYLDAYSDWDNPLLVKMGHVEDMYRKYIMSK
ncbi:MAG: hypothetical protein K6F01_01460 [Selenomonas sp.]|uniref:hypothetical protein n=1 Tax=Selenomonas sp. TaxID=2053611 RepID=UPI0025F16693|nr:hypothetical protein [Selenomonas sp.]MCR5438115.1 hypothetical protein [Selenomonas sp.]